MTASHPERIDDLLDAVSERRRRSILRHLAENGDTPVPVEELVAAIPDGGTGPTSGADEVTLHHTTLPKLAELGLLEYDPDSRTVRARVDDEVEQLLTFVAEHFE